MFRSKASCSLTFISSLSLISLLLLPFGGTHQLFENQLDKCCPNGQSLSVARQPNGTIFYDCVPAVGQTLFGYNIRHSDDDESQIPRCDNLIANDFSTENSVIATNGCLDTTADDTVSSLKCPHQQNIDVHLVYKCCAADYSYDFNERMCVPNANDLNSFARVFGESVVVFRTQIPRCNDDEVFVEYHTTTHDIWFSRSSIIVTSKYRESETLPSHTFCIEGTVNHTMNDIENPDASHVIVRSCRPRTICERIPCVRRCCENDQMMVRDKVTRRGVCVAHAMQKNLHPIFHDVGEWTLDVPQQIRTAGNSPLSTRTFLRSIVSRKAYRANKLQRNFVKIRFALT